MTNRFRTAVLCVGFAISLGCGALYASKQNSQVPPAPIPTSILTATKVFIANAGGDESRFDAPQYTGGPNRMYNEFYAAVKSWGRYEIVDSPASADLVFEIRLTVYQLSRTEVLKDEGYRTDPQFRLAVRDAKTHQILWGLTEHAQPAILQDNRDKNFEQALNGILAELKKIAGPAQSAAKQSPN